MTSCSYILLPRVDGTRISSLITLLTHSKDNARYYFMYFAITTHSNKHIMLTLKKQSNALASILVIDFITNYVIALQNLIEGITANIYSYWQHEVYVCFIFKQDK